LTLFTTLAAAMIALGLFLFIGPAQFIETQNISGAGESNQSYLSYLLGVIPSNFVQPFLDGNVISILMIALLLAFSTLSLPGEHRVRLHDFFASLYTAIMKIALVTLNFLPIAVCAFVAIFVKEIHNGITLEALGLYLLTIVSANLVQAFIFLPGLLLFYGISPLRLVRGMSPALSVAFFSKSSCCAMPIAIQSAEDRVGISPKVARFSFPLCTTINMNACAGFILITVLFVSQSNGIIFSAYDYILWIGIATLAAIGNAGVPMGCYFLASALLTTLNLPLTWMGIILPFYSLIDMLETAINIWSDSCVTAIVDRKQNK
ncbi:MAG: cation:dicarboxylase symporter family transporter, partial [Myxococcaceae bacterium]